MSCSRPTASFNPSSPSSVVAQLDVLGSEHQLDALRERRLVLNQQDTHHSTPAAIANNWVRGVKIG
jgi:hypothetical protein